MSSRFLDLLYGASPEVRAKLQTVPFTCNTTKSALLAHYIFENGCEVLVANSTRVGACSFTVRFPTGPTQPSTGESHSLILGVWTIDCVTGECYKQCITDVRMLMFLDSPKRGVGTV